MPGKTWNLMGQVYVCVEREGQGFGYTCLELGDDRGRAREWRLCKENRPIKRFLRINAL